MLADNSHKDCMTGVTTRQKRPDHDGNEDTYVGNKLAFISSALVLTLSFVHDILEGAEGSCH